MYRRNRSWVWRASPLLALVFLFVTLGLLPGARPAAAAPARADAVYNVTFLPSQFFRLCVGDRHPYSFSVSYVEPENPEPVPVDENGNPLPVPLQVYRATVTASHGTVEPSEFLITTTPQVFRFNYTAQSEGPETFQVTLSNGAKGSGSKNIQIIGTCNYSVYFFGKDRQSGEGGMVGFDVVLKGQGNFWLDRTAAGANSVTGNGSDEASLGLWGEAPGAFSCSMIPIRSSSNFRVEGTLQPDNGFMTITLHNDPMKFTGSMHFECELVGQDNATIDVPIGEQAGSPSGSDLGPLTFPITGGSEHFQFGTSHGIIVVTLKK